LAVLCVLVGCGSDHAFAPLPPLDGGRSMVVDLGGTSILAIDLVAGPAMLDWPRGRALPRLEAWVYRRSLSELGLPAGLITVQSSGEPLEAADAAFELDLGQGAREWTRLSTASGTLHGVRVSSPWRCREIFVQPQNIGAVTLTPLASAPLPPDRMLLATSDKHLWVVSATGAEELSVEGVGSHLYMAIAAPLGQPIYLARTGLVADAAMEGTALHARRLGDAPRARDDRRRCGNPVHPESVLCPARRQAQGGAMRRWATFPAASAETTAEWSRRARVALAARASSHQVLRYDHGVVRWEAPGAVSELITRLSEGRPGSALVGTILGTVLELQGGVWTPLFSLAPADTITALTPFEDGVLFGTSSGEIGYFTPRDGVCRSAGVVLPNNPTTFAPGPNGAWLVAGNRPFAAGLTKVAVVRIGP
jgi:hypothetical protein